ncbi:MAG TPA: DUF2508 family protein [Tissierellaceae bacterium]|nr:DUF2508 family protein [Tissierellaceae bacterium]
MNNIKEKIMNLIQKLKSSLLRDGVELNEKERLIRSAKEAHKEWLAKEEYFNDVTDPDLVDFAIYDIEASKRKYTYLLKKVKKEKNM